jgi:hypothetical protein
MACRFYRSHRQIVHAIGGDNGIVILDGCLLKAGNEEKQIEMYEKLHALKLDQGLIGDDCPLAASGRWQECPYYESP